MAALRTDRLWPRRTLGAAVAVAALIALSGCGGPSLLPEQHATARLTVDQGQATAWLNAYRQDHGLATVSEDGALVALAQRQADAMAAANELSHTVIGALPRRLATIGREKGAAAENVSAGYHDMADALGGWRRSPEHNANLLYAPIRRVGVAGAAAPGTRYKTFWALVMTD